MHVSRFLPLLVLVLTTACATPRPAAVLEMPAGDTAHAAHLLAGFLLAQGWTVTVPGDSVVAAQRGAERLWLRPLLDPRGMDRLVAWRQWPADPAVDAATLGEFADELNEVLNVGLFRAAPEGLVFQVSLHFIDVLDPALLGAFVEHTAEVRGAVLQVQEARRLLQPVEAAPGSR